jgi:hypothetical protein
MNEYQPFLFAFAFLRHFLLGFYRFGYAQEENISGESQNARILLLSLL